MTLTLGTRLDSHEIVGLLGVGGMGEVYRALDTKLNRQVAIKVLPEAYAADAERVARFHREAQAVAALNHPRIAAIYDLAEAGSTRYLVLELVEGDTLADRIRRGPVAIDEAIAIAIQILDALEAAHEKGICHRDLKPANIKLTPDGTIKVLDFGLAKFLESNPSAPNLTQSPTLSVAGTIPGVIMGTAGYMSPEQAKGYQADHRSDIFSFGCIFYELLTGRQAFDGDTVSEILAGVLKVEVDLATLPPRLNPRLLDLLRRCLEKNPKKRWHAAADVRVELEAIAGRAIVVDEAPVAAPAAPRAWWRRALPWAAGILLGGVAAGSAAWVLKPEPVRTVTRFVIPLPDGQQFTNTGRQLVALSPDGSNLVYVANNRLHLRPMSGLEPRVIPGSEIGAGISSPVFSPDGQTLAFYSVSDRTLKRLTITGGAAVTISPIDLPPFGLGWDENGLVFGQGPNGILRVSPNGGTTEVLATVASDEIASLPQLLPGGTAVLFTVKKINDNWDSGKIVVQVVGGERKTLVDGGADGRYLPPGHLVYARSGTLLAVPFDLASLSVAGGAVPVIEGVRRAGLGSGQATTGGAQFSYARNGTMAYLPGSAILGTSESLDLALFDRKGVARPLGLKPGSYRSPRVSPDGRLVAFEIEGDQESSVWVYELSGGRAMQRLTFGGNNRHPIWSRDGRWVAFQSDRDGDLAIFRQLADGSGKAERLTRPETGTEHIPQSWSQGDVHLLFSVLKDKVWTLWTMNLKDRQPTAFGDVRSIELIEGAFSPDGQWVAYQSRENDDGRMVFVQPFPSTGAKYLARPEGGGHPYWSPKGDELILNIGPSRSVRIPFTTAPRVAFGAPVDFSRIGRLEPNPGIERRYADSLPDGEHIIGIYTGGASGTDPLQIQVVLYWFDEVRQRVQ